CDAAYVDCNGDPADGCEAHVPTDPAHCGSCDNACNEFQTCQGGLCVLSCPAGSDDCDGDAGNGCETPLGTDTDCAACDDACAFPNAGGICAQGACALGACDLGFDDCDDIPGNGCEASLLTSTSTCGDCNTICPVGPHSTAVCNAGGCGIVCMGTWADCNGDPADGCEADTTTSTAHCGACNRSCSSANIASLTCAGGTCTSTCLAGWGNCLSPVAPMPDDGCEAHLDTDVAHCGACGRACAGTDVASRSCSGGACDSTCDLGFANCSQPLAGAGADDGCELDVTQSSTNCGGCGNACSGGLDCDRPQNGPTQRYCGCSVNNECDTDGAGPAAGTCTASTGLCACGGTPCAVGEACVNVGGVNQCSCNGAAGCGAGQACCQAPAGCFDLLTDPSSCGACGRACAAGFACASGACACDADADCDAGSAGTCNGLGRCVCGGVTCGIGERCLPAGGCG
ncbi:MAG: hypothetical protein IT372_05810, partial [Polyangiaceae bacterium]|nr:hypothetical protein [Polyangiaceae bacterium]